METLIFIFVVVFSLFLFRVTKRRIFASSKSASLLISAWHLFFAGEKKLVPTLGKSSGKHRGTEEKATKRKRRRTIRAAAASASVEIVLPSAPENIVRSFVESSRVWNAPERVRSRLRRKKNETKRKFLRYCKIPSRFYLLQQFR